ncbi:MAG: AAA family ATPase [Betaproteobacteria bacterium]|nr:AAA family ATPase [Betaproteobacteria bacterium]
MNNPNNSNNRVPAFDTQLKRPALYNPGLWSVAEVRAYYIARTSLLNRLLDDIRRETPGSQPQHRLIVGQRGMGKSTLLRRLAIGIEDDTQLESQWLPLVFPEEQYNVASLADFWLNCLDALGDLQEARGDHAQAAAIDAEVERLDRGDSDGALQALLRTAGKLQRRLLLLVDNIDLILDRIKTQDWTLREVLQGHPEIMLIGASSRALEASYNYRAAFYDFFKIDELRGLSLDEMRETILTLARLRGAADVIERVAADPGRLPVLHTLTGGNPRTAVLLYGVLLKGVDGDVRSDLEALLDEVTPLYKARFDELPTQAQQLLDKLALNWDPITARGLADLLGWQVNLVSAQLDRLSASGVVEKVKFGKGKRIAFQVGERFFNIWYLMRASRRVRRKLMWLVEFLRVFFSSDELQRLAKRRLSACPSDEQDAEYTLAISRALGALPLARALETQALDTLLSGKWGGSRDGASANDTERLARKALLEEPDGTCYLHALAGALSEQGRFDEALPHIRKLCDIAPSDAHNWRLMVVALSNGQTAAAEQIAAARHAFELEPEDQRSILVLVCSLLVHGNANEALSYCRQWLGLIASNEPSSTGALSSLITLLQIACATNHGAEMLTALDATEAGQRFRPVREALAAVVAGTADVLNSVAPEIRKPALEILALIAPSLLKDTP